MALDSTLFWLICLMLTINVRADHFGYEDEDVKGTYDDVTTTEYGPALGAHIAPRVQACTRGGASGGGGLPGLKARGVIVNLHVFCTCSSNSAKCIYMMDQISSFQQNQAILMATGSAIPYFLRWQIM